MPSSEQVSRSSDSRICTVEALASGSTPQTCATLTTRSQSRARRRMIATSATRADVAAAVSRVHPAFEIIETRGDLSGQLALAVTDNGQQKAFVLGQPVNREALPELSAVTVRVRINGAEIATASGDAVLGHPYNSVVWLASKLAQFGERVGAGDYIMSGSFTRQFPLGRGDRIEAVFDGDQKTPECHQF